MVWSVPNFFFNTGMLKNACASLSSPTRWYSTRQNLGLGPEGEDSGFVPKPYKTKVAMRDYFCMTGYVCKCRPGRLQLSFS